jgi:hypothetical protein
VTQSILFSLLPKILSQVFGELSPRWQNLAIMSTHGFTIFPYIAALVHKTLYVEFLAAQHWRWQQRGLYS